MFELLASLVFVAQAALPVNPTSTAPLSPILEAPQDPTPAAIAKPAGPVTDSYELSLNYSILTEHFGVPSYVVNDGEGTSLVKEAGGKRYYLDIKADEFQQDKKAVRMVFLAGILNPDGTKTEVSQASLIARLGQRAKMSVTSDEGKTELSVNVLARKKTSVSK